MSDEKTNNDNMDDFTRLVIEQENIGVKVDDEEQAILVLNSLPKSFENFVDTMRYIKEKLTLGEVQVVPKSKELESKLANEVAEGLTAEEGLIKDS